MEERQAPDGVQRDQHLHQKLLVLCFEGEGEAVDDAEGAEEEEVAVSRRQGHQATGLHMIQADPAEPCPVTASRAAAVLSKGFIDQRPGEI